MLYRSALVHGGDQLSRVYCSGNVAWMPFKQTPPHSQGALPGDELGGPAYEAGLRRRGDMTVWLDEAALAGWHAPRWTTPGGQPRYSDLAIELMLTLRLILHLPLR